MQTLIRPHAPNKSQSGLGSPRARRRRFSPLMLISVIVTLVIVLGAGVFLAVQKGIFSHAAGDNPNCSLQIPNQPLTAQGLATPYQFSATDPAQGACNEANTNQSAFVQAAIFDPATNTLSAYEPLVVDKGTQPAVAPVVPTLPQGAIVALWFGFNGTFLHLTGDTNGGRCVNGLNGSDFGQFAYCNAPRFFRNVNRAIQAQKITVPPIGTASDGQACPTTRSFGVVDMDQSDNVQTRYLVTANGQSAQLNAANQAQLQGATPIGNPSDNALVSRVLDPALGCQAWEIPSLSNNGTMTPTLATDELQAAANQQAPIALVPSGDEMVLINNQQSLAKVNAYRVGVDQMPAATAAGADTTTYCSNLINIALPKLQLDMPNFLNQASPIPAAGNSLFTFLAGRLNATLGNGGLNCTGLLNIQNPVTLTTDGNGVVTAATLTITGTGTGTGTATPVATATMGTTPVATPTMGTTPVVTPTMTGTGGTGTGTAPNCNVNGTAIAGCMGTTTINGQTCTLAFAQGTVTVTCPTTQGGGGTGTGGTGGTPTVLPFNNSGTSDDANMGTGNFDGAGFSYSVEALQNAGITPGKTVTFNGVTFTWPASKAGTADNVQAQGQTIPVTAAKGATTLAFLGSASFGPSSGTATITYSDGTTQQFSLAFSDWTLSGGGAPLLSGEQVVANTTYRDSAGGMQLNQMPNVFYVGVALQAGKTIQSVTLPATANQGQIHVFAIGTK